MADPRRYRRCRSYRREVHDEREHDDRHELQHLHHQHRLLAARHVAALGAKLPKIKKKIVAFFFFRSRIPATATKGYHRFTITST